MKNIYDNNWKKIKKNIALFNKEITLLWNCGIHNRNLAWNKGIKNYNNLLLNTNILGFENSSKEKIINQMLEILHSDKNFILNKKNNFLNWQHKKKWEFFIDFETYNTDAYYDENTDWDSNLLSNTQIIYMIGVSHINNDIYEHKTFIINYKDCSELFINLNSDLNCKLDSYEFCENELDLIINFSKYINNFKPESMSIEKFKNNIRLIHWSNAEPLLFNKKINEYELFNDNINFDWYDLLKIFKHDKYPIIIKECFSFGLKEIIRKLNEYKLINLSWSDLDDGLLSSFIAREIYLSEKINKNVEMINIAEYNFIDCKAVYTILEWMRENI